MLLAGAPGQADVPSDVPVQHDPHLVQTVPAGVLQRHRHPAAAPGDPRGDTGVLGGADPVEETRKIGEAYAYPACRITQSE
ncbi:hypothetical protein Aca07nite_22850 [Actinoplanes capillaceus]|uniref:Uncharacterized protein n=1 Tax=Actinoplanes campanulatus TaxID=113559 RepID=A0ABQ3WFV0_9ACTN|nr:hypothetical protein Aca07nite_22850 [Actinoplanes capillaceus]